MIEVKMVKNTIGGKHHKKQKRFIDTPDDIRNFPWADNTVTFFGKVTTLYGGNMLEVMIDEKPYKCRIPGSFRKKVWIGKGDLVLVHYDKDCEVREVSYVYKSVEANIIKSAGVWEDVQQDEVSEDIIFTNDGNLDISAI